MPLSTADGGSARRLPGTMACRWRRCQTPWPASHVKWFI